MTRPTSALSAAHAQATQQAQAALEHSPRAVLVTAAVDPCFPPFPIDMEHMQRSHSSAACSSTAKGEKARLARPASTPSLKLAEKPIRATHTHGRPSTAPLTPGKPPQHIDAHFAASQRCTRPRTAPLPCKPSARISARAPTVLSSASAAALSTSGVVHSPAAATSCTPSSCRPATELLAGLSAAGRMHVREQTCPQTHRTAAGRIENHSAAGKSSLSDSATHPQRSGQRSVELVAPAPRAMSATRQMRHASGVEARDVELRRPLSKAASMSSDKEGTEAVNVEAHRASRQPLPQHQERGLIWSQLWPWPAPEEKRPPPQCLPVTAMATAAQRRMPPSSYAYASPPAPDLLSATLSLSEFKSSFGLEAHMAARATRTNSTVVRPRPRNQMRPSERSVASGPVVAAPHVQHVQQDALRNSHYSMPLGGAKLPVSSRPIYAIPRSQQLQSVTIATQDVRTRSTRTTTESSFNAHEPLRGWC